VLAVRAVAAALQIVKLFGFGSAVVPASAMIGAIAGLVNVFGVEALACALPAPHAGSEIPTPI